MQTLLLTVAQGRNALCEAARRDMGAMPWPVAWMQHGDVAATKPTQEVTWDVTHEGTMPHARIGSHGRNAMTRCCIKKG